MPALATRGTHMGAPESPQLRTAKQEIAEYIHRAFAPHTALEATAAYSDPAQITAALQEILDKHFAPPKPEPVDLTRARDDILEHAAIVERPITRQRIRRMQQQLKTIWFWSASDMAKQLNVSRGQLKNIESGKRKPSAEFQRRFRWLEKLVSAWAQENKTQASESLIVETNQRLPRRYRVLHRVVKCKNCDIHFEQMNSRHRKHAPDCKPNKGRKRQ